VSRYRIQHYTSSVTIPAGSNTISDVLTGDLNGLLRGIIINPPASLTGSSYSFTASGYYTISTLSAGSKSINTVDSHNNPLQFPIASKKGDSWLTITVAGDTAATGTLTSDTTEVSDGDTVTIGSTVYRFKTTIAQINDVHRTGTADTTLGNLAKAINANGVAGTDYFTGTVANTQVSSSTVSSHAITITALVETAAGNSIATTTTATHLSWGASTLAGSGEASDRTFSIEAFIES
jgi:hypothetical protein